MSKSCFSLLLDILDKAASTKDLQEKFVKNDLVTSYFTVGKH